MALAGCSAVRLGYNQGPTLSYWYLDRYFDFDDRQSVRVRDGLQEWFRWHRATQLTDLAGLLVRAEAQALEPTNAATVCRWTDELTQRLDTAYDHALPAMVEVIAMMGPTQLKQLEKRYRRSNAEFKDDFLQPDPEDRRQAAVKRVVEQAEMLYGRLDDAQLAVIAKSVATSPFDPQGWLGERLVRQQDVLSSLRRWTTEKSSPEVVRAGLKRLLQNTLQSKRESYRAYQQKLIDYNCAFAADLHNATTPAQRQQAVKKLKGWEDDLRALAAEAGS